MTITSQSPRVADLDDRDRDCIRALYDASSAYESRRSRHRLPVEGTCGWVLDDETFTAWEEGTSGLLWVTANVASGKSVFANGYVEHVVKTRIDAVVGSFFFHGDSAGEALSAVLHQIFTKHPGATRYAREDFAVKGRHFTNDTKALWRILCDISRDFFSDAVEVLLVLDDLDNCSEPSRDDLIHELTSTFCGNADVPGHLKVLITSRPSSEIARVLRPIRKNTYFRLENANTTSPRPSGTPDVASLPVTRIAHLMGEDNTMDLSHDVDVVARFRLDELRSKNVLADANFHFLRREINAPANDSFLWICIVFNHLGGDSMARSGIEAAIQTAKEELHCLYEEALQQTSVAGRALLQCMIAAEGPLTLGEINVALALRDGVSTVAALTQELEPDIEHTVRRLGGFFVRVANGRVHFVHPTARMFLEEREPSPGRAPLDRPSCNLIMAERCLRMLTGICEPRDVSSGLPLDRPPGEDSFDSPLDKPPFEAFYRYAAEHWHRFTEGANMHATFDRKCNPSPAADKLWESIRLLCNPLGSFFGVWWPVFASDGRATRVKFMRRGSQWYALPEAQGQLPAAERLLHRAARNNSVAVLHALLVSAPQLSITNVGEKGVDILCAAVSDECWSVVSWVLQNFPDTPLKREAALKIALRSNNVDAVSFVVYPSAWSSFSSGDNSPLDGAEPPFFTSGMEPETVDLLVGNLSYACLWGRATLVSELIKAGADANRTSGGFSPLLAAVLSGDAGLVDTLLKHGASPDTPCSPAIDPSEPSLSDLDARPHTLSADFLCTFWHRVWKYLGPSCHGITPLGLAAQVNNPSISQALQKRGNTDETTELALRRAFPSRPEDSTPSDELRKITLQHLHLLKTPEALGQKICHEAVAHAPVAVIEELIRYGGLELPRDSSCRTLLHVAAETGNVETVAALCRAASHETLFARDNLSRTCLRVALQAGHRDVAKKILEVDGSLGVGSLASQARGCKTMLHDAVYGGVKKGAGVVKDVLALGEEVDARDWEGRTPLHHVVLAIKSWDYLSGDACGAVDVVKALVIAGAEYNLADDENQTPLALASTVLAEGAGLPEEVRAALEELEATLIRVPLWGDNRLDAGAIRGNYEQFLSEGKARQGDGDIDFGDNWMYESEDCADDVYHHDDDEDDIYD